MGNYNLPTNALELIGLGTKMHTGMVALATPLGLTLITTAQMQTNLTAFIAQNNGYNAQRSAVQVASDVWQGEQAAVYDWLLAMRANLVSHWGTTYSMQWAQAGFINSKTAVPMKIELRLGLVLSLTNFLTNNPSYEVPANHLTAAYATTLRTAALAAQAAVASAKVTLDGLAVAWQSAYDVLTKGMRDLLRNLTSVLAADDARWLQFGLQMPSTITTPGQPVNVTATTDGSGAIIVACDAVPLATRYRWRTRVAGLQPDYVLAASTTQPLGALTGFEPGVPVQIVVQAVNAGLQGRASEPITYTIPVGTVSAPKAEEVLPASNGNGHGPAHHANGNGNIPALARR